MFGKQGNELNLRMISMSSFGDHQTMSNEHFQPKLEMRMFAWTIFFCKATELFVSAQSMSPKGRSRNGHALSQQPLSPGVRSRFHLWAEAAMVTGAASRRNQKAEAAMVSGPDIPRPFVNEKTPPLVACKQFCFEGHKRVMRDQSWSATL